LVAVDGLLWGLFDGGGGWFVVTFGGGGFVVACFGCHGDTGSVTVCGGSVVDGGD
jgi:hypothetical protein